MSIEVQKWHGGHYIVSGGNSGSGHLNVVNFYLFFSQYFGPETSDDYGNLHYVFEEKHNADPVKYNITPKCLFPYRVL